jgi:hypothetical protein
LAKYSKLITSPLRRGFSLRERCGRSSCWQINSRNLGPVSPPGAGLFFERLSRRLAAWVTVRGRRATIARPRRTQPNAAPPSSGGVLVWHGSQVSWVGEAAFGLPPNHLDVGAHSHPARPTCPGGFSLPRRGWLLFCSSRRSQRTVISWKHNCNPAYAILRPLDPVPGPASAPSPMRAGGAFLFAAGSTSVRAVHATVGGRNELRSSLAARSIAEPERELAVSNSRHTGRQNGLAANRAPLRLPTGAGLTMSARPVRNQVAAAVGGRRSRSGPRATIAPPRPRQLNILASGVFRI